MEIVLYATKVTHVCRVSESHTTRLLINRRKNCWRSSSQSTKYWHTYCCCNLVSDIVLVSLLVQFLLSQNLTANIQLARNKPTSNNNKNKEVMLIRNTGPPARLAPRQAEQHRRKRAPCCWWKSNASTNCEPTNAMEDISCCPIGNDGPCT